MRVSSAFATFWNRVITYWRQPANMFDAYRGLQAHPLPYKPYNQIKFAHVDGNRTLVFVVADEKKPRGPIASLKAAFLRFGAQCFHCKTKLRAGPLSDVGSIDHVRPKCEGGTDEIHNLVIACKHCNKMKGRRLLARFNGDLGDEYLAAMNEHVSRLLDLFRQAETGGSTTGAKAA